MNKFLKLKIQRFDIIANLVWLAIFLLILVFTYQKWGSPAIDCGRDPYVAECILSGDKLYSDVFYTYGPLTPYILALLFFICGINLNTIYFTGIIISILILSCIYYISRQLLSPLWSVLIVSFCIIIFCFKPFIFNYIFPYTYSALFSELFSLLFVISVILHLKSQNKIYLIFTGSLAGLCSLTKVEFAFTLNILMVVYIIFGNIFNVNIPFKDMLKAILPAVLIPISFYTFIFLSSGFNNIIEYFDYLEISLKSQPSVFFINNMFGFEKMMANLYNWPPLSSVIIIFLFIYIYFKINIYKYLNFYLYMILGLSILFIDPSNFITRFIIDSIIQLSLITNILSYESLISAVVIVILLIKRYLFKQTLSIELNILLVLAIYSLLISLRSFLYLDIRSYGVYYLPLFLVVVFYLLFILSTYFKNREYFEKSLFCIVIIILLVNLSSTFISYSKINQAIETPRGRILTEKRFADPLNLLISSIYYNTKPGDKILIAPEETLIYFLTERKSLTRFYDYLPIRLSTPQQEDYLIESIKSKNTKLIAITNRTAYEYLYPYWGQDYNQKTAKWIIKNYKLCDIYGKYNITDDDSGSYGILMFKKDCLK